MNRIDPMTWKADMPAFREKTKAFFAGELSKGDYKGFSGLYGSYAQKGGTASMLRLRMTAGVVTKEKMAFTAAKVREHNVNLIKFTTCEAIQLHNMGQEALFDTMESALDAGIVTMGGGGDFPRNVMCSPLSGVEKGEYFDVLPYAQEAAEYLMNFIKAEKMPRKLKVCFSNSPENVPHATFRDLGFVAREDGKFDVYSAGGLGNNPKFGVKVAEAVEADQVLYYIKAMWLTFRTYGDYKNRGRARTRYMQEICGGPEQYKAAYLEKLKEVYDEGEDLKLDVKSSPILKQGDGTTASGVRVAEQKQAGLYTVSWHPIGGKPAPAVFCELSDAMQGMEDVQLRLSPDETAYIVNLTGAEAEKVLAITAQDTAASLFETSVSCVGASICQVGVRDSQELLANCVKAVREADLPDGALPQIHISGCPSSCGTHQIGKIGFRGAAKKTAEGTKAAFLLCINGCDKQGAEVMGQEVGTIVAEDIPAFLVTLGKAVAESGKDYETWNRENPEGIVKIASPFTA